MEVEFQFLLASKIFARGRGLTDCSMMRPQHILDPASSPAAVHLMETRR